MQIFDKHGVRVKEESKTISLKEIFSLMEDYNIDEFVENTTTTVNGEGKPLVNVNRSIKRNSVEVIKKRNSQKDEEKNEENKEKEKKVGEEQ